MPTQPDQRRMEDGAKAMSVVLSDDLEELEGQIRQMVDAGAAIQSLDTLGSPEMNARAWKTVIALERKLDQAREKWNLMVGEAGMKRVAPWWGWPS